MTFESATVDDFCRHLEGLLQEAAEECARATSEVLKKTSQAGGLRERAIMEIHQAVREQHKKAVSGAAGRLIRFHLDQGTPINQLVESARPILIRFCEDIVSTLPPPRSPSWPQPEQLVSELVGSTEHALADATKGYVDGRMTEMPNYSSAEKRFLFLRTLYDMTEDDVSKAVSLYEIGNRAGLDRKTTESARAHLYHLGLLESVTLEGATRLTAKGLAEVEKAINYPERATESFPPMFNVIQNYGQMTGTTIQQAGPGAQQVAHLSTSQSDEVRRALREIESQIGELIGDADTVANAQADIDTVRAQLKSTEPKASIIKETLISLQRTIGSAAESTLRTALTDRLNAMIAWVTSS